MLLPLFSPNLPFCSYFSIFKILTPLTNKNLYYALYMFCFLGQKTSQKTKVHKYCARTLSANSVLHITLSSLKTTKKTKSHHQIQQSYWPFFFKKKSSCLQTILFCLTLKIMFFLLAFPSVLIILIYVANPLHI